MLEFLWIAFRVMLIICALIGSFYVFNYLALGMPTRKPLKLKDITLPRAEAPPNEYAHRFDYNPHTKKWDYNLLWSYGSLAFALLIAIGLGKILF